MKILITSGGTREAIDPVRFIGNSSSGKMGEALAEIAKNKYLAKVIRLDAAQGSAEDLRQAVLKHYAKVDIVIMAAAVADYTPVKPVKDKIKKQKTTLTIKLKPTQDILSELGRLKKKQLLVGFCLESKDLIREAKIKLIAKNLDIIVANDASAIGSDLSKAVLITRDKTIKLPKMSKLKLADKILAMIMELPR
jgi:phosphopantothenoylcysteine decarboxylase/phosphopantothenate--cysteine ligase